MIRAPDCANAEEKTTVNMTNEKAEALYMMFLA
jgi:hypothetical protein